MKIRLKNIVQIQPGVYLKSADKETDCLLLNLRDFDEELNYLGTGQFVEGQKVRDKYFLTENDILFSTKYIFKAYQPKSDKRLAAGNSFVILRPVSRKVLPDYLAWYLNHPEQQLRFARLGEDRTKISFLNTKELKEFEVEIPDLAKQESIIKIANLLKKEKELHFKIAEKKQTYIQSILSKTIKE